ncbi:GNAT family N-acetyltransferase [Ferrimonas balearica]|uniref:GNAT family N-acetyltransferase n=1 Tax=Ferrimonas balearica TaxID=44012 RepID=UPI001C999798|nr:GNAT family N-acetyltransferase [Ferrimonas balearica]MBY5992364.1 GNAT family N-acetyltransferase [Ferrimonas balearica]
MSALLAVPRLSTPRSLVTLLSPVAEDAAKMARYCRDNRTHLAPWEPTRDDSWYCERTWLTRLDGQWQQFERCTALSLVALDPQGEAVIAVVNLSGIEGGVRQSARVGYSVAQHRQGAGLATEVVGAVVDYAFDTLKLHRIEACVQPHNLASVAVLARLGFRREGFAPQYLKINGRWQDHILTARLSPNALAVPSTPDAILSP